MMLLNPFSTAENAGNLGETILLLALVMGIAIIFGKLARILRLPSVTGYLLAGIIIGPYALGYFGFGFSTLDRVQDFDIISKIALGFMTFTIGAEFKFHMFKLIGKKAVVITIVQALVCALVVDAALIGLHFIMPEKFDLSTAIILGAIATVTAPATGLMVTRQYKAKGELTNISHLVVELSEIVGLFIFSVSLALAKGIENKDVSTAAVIIVPVFEIVLSLGLGAAVGLILSMLTKMFKGEVVKYCIVICVVIATVGICEYFAHDINIDGSHIEISSVMTCLMAGVIFCNTQKHVHSVMSHVEYWTVPLFMMFFTIAGAGIDFAKLTTAAIIIGMVYVIFRSIGKYFGAQAGASLMRCDKKVRRYLGFTLLPQTAVALAMATIIQAENLAQSSTITAVIIFAVLIFELLGSFFTKWALRRAGDITAKNAMSEDDYSEEDDVISVKAEKEIIKTYLKKTVSNADSSQIHHSEPQHLAPNSSIVDSGWGETKDSHNADEHNEEDSSEPHDTNDDGDNGDNTGDGHSETASSDEISKLREKIYR